MKEVTYTTNLIYALQKRGAKALKFNPMFSGKNEPDIFGVYKSVPFVIECKVYPNTITHGQRVRHDEWSAVGALVFVATYPKDGVFDMANRVCLACEAHISLNMDK